MKVEDYNWEKGIKEKNRKREDEGEERNGKRNQEIER